MRDIYSHSLNTLSVFSLYKILCCLELRNRLEHPNNLPVLKLSDAKILAATGGLLFCLTLLRTACLRFGSNHRASAGSSILSLPATSCSCTTETSLIH